MKRLLLMYSAAIRTAIASATAYRTNFFIVWLIILANNLGVPFVTILIYGAGARIPGWSLYEALLIQSCFMLTTGIAAPFIYNMVWVTMGHVKEGTYDLLLIKPCPVIFTTMAYTFELESVGMLIGGAFIMSFSLSKLPPVEPIQWLMFAYYALCGIIMLFGLMCLMSATAFKWVGNGRIFEIFSAVTGFGRYPASIFPRWLSTAVSWVIPISAMGYLPASTILGKSQPIDALVILPCIAFAVFGVFVFNRMINSYQSAGG